MRKFLMGISLFLSSLFSCSSLVAYDASPPCFRILESNYFEPGALYQALSLHHVIQSQWNLIYQDLAKRSRDIPKIVKDKASRLSPNPLQDPYNKDVAVQILHDALYSLFVDVLRIHNITNESDIKNMFDYILSRKPEALQQCFISEPKSSPR